MSDIPTLCDRLIRWGLVVLVTFTPLAFGTVESWSMALMEWGIVTLFLVFWLGRVWQGRSQPAHPPTGRTGIEVPLGLFLLFCAFQTIPLPLTVLERISPGSVRMYQDPGLASQVRTEQTDAAAIPADALTEPRTVTRRPISVRPRETWSRIRLVVSFGCLFLLTAWWATRERIVFMLETMTVVGFLVALFGLVQFLTWNGKIYWVRKVPPSSSFGPFVNHNHFAGYVEMIIPVAISLAFYLVEIRRRGRVPVSSSRDGGAQLDASVEERSRWGKGGLAFFVAVILVVSLFFSLSRGGILSAMISAVILFMLVGRRIASRALTWSLALALPVLAVAFITWIGPRAVAQQLGTYPGMEEETSFKLRATLWNRMIQRLPEYLWTGSGLGAFEESFAPFVPPGSPKRWDKAHNDYLQLLWETGVVGALLWLSALMIFARRYWWPSLRTRVHPLDVLRMGIAVSLLSIALHSLVDFNLQIGANGFLCALLAGLLVALERAVGRNGPRAQT